MRKTLAQAKASSIPQAVGLAACDSRFLNLLNEAQSRLADMGKWWGTYKRLRVCVTAGCITWPREVKTVEAMNVCGIGIPIQNGWYEFQQDVPAPGIGCESCEQRQLLDRGMVTQFRDFTGLSKVRIYVSQASDVGKRVLLQGLDGNGNAIRTLDSVSGDYVWGEYVTLASPFVQSTNSFALPGLTGAQKPLTNGRLTVTGVNVVSNVETQVSVWEPAETNPSYRRTYLVNRPTGCSDNNNTCSDRGDGCTPADESCAGSMTEAIVRMEFIPAVVDQDWLFIENIDAVKHMMKAIQREDRNQYAEAEREIQLALRSLRNELDAYSPAERTVINVLSYGTANPRKIFGGFI
jgi:hypothetical protein